MNQCSIVLAALLIVSAAGLAAGDDGAAEYVIGQELIGAGRLAEAEAALRRGLAIDEASDGGSSDPSRRAREVSTLDVLASLAAWRPSAVIPTRRKSFSGARSSSARRHPAFPTWR